MVLDTISPIDTSTFQERIYERIKSGLLSGEFQPGEVLSIKALARLVGTSAMPVRDALNRLVAEQALVKSPDRMIRVAPYTKEIYDEHIRIRMKLEGFAAQRACSALDKPRLLELLREVNQEMLQAANAKDIKRAVETNKVFHFAIYEAARYPQLLQMIAHMWLRTGPFVATARKNPSDAGEMFKTGYEFHNRAIAAIAAGDGRAARFALSGDIRTATYWLEKHQAFSTEPA